MLGTYWHVPALLLGILGLAFLVNRFAPDKRKRVRRCVILFAFVLVLLGGAEVFRHDPAWKLRFGVASDIVEAFLVINLVATTIFDLVLPKTKVRLASIASDLTVGVAYVVTAISILAAAGMNPASVVATSAIVSGVFLFSIQTTLGSVLGGVAIQLDGSVHVGDWVQLENGKQGKVREIRWRHTVLETRDWSTIIVPNASLLTQNITILGRRGGENVPQRMWVYFNVDFRFPPSRVVEVVTEALLASPIERVASDPKPNVICMDIARDGKDSFGLYAVRYWLTDLAVDDPTSSAVRTRIFAALRRAQIPLARPTLSVFVDPDDETDVKEREARHRERRLRLVERMDLFKPLTIEEKAELAEHLTFTPFTAGEVMTRQGAVAHWLYLVATGRAEVRARIKATSEVRTVATIDAPDFFGEMGLMTGEPRQADVVALTDVECLRLDKAGFEAIIMKRPELATEMSKKLAHRRVELEAVRDNLDAAAKAAREKNEQERILGRIQDFFGLR